MLDKKELKARVAKLGSFAEVARMLGYSYSHLYNVISDTQSSKKTSNSFLWKLEKIEKERGIK